MTRESPAGAGPSVITSPKVAPQGYTTINDLVAAMSAGTWTPEPGSVGDSLSKPLGGLGVLYLRRFARDRINSREDLWWLRLADDPSDLDDGDLRWILARWEETVLGVAA